MSFDDAYLEEAHAHCFNNLNEVNRSKLCGCIHCLKMFEPSSIDRRDDVNAKDGIAVACPNCFIDGVLGDVSGFPISDEAFMSAMNKRWFAGGVFARDPAWGKNDKIMDVPTKLPPLPLPFNATSNKAAVVITMIMVISPFLTAGVLFLALNLVDNKLSPQLRQMLPVVYFVLVLPINIFICAFMKPRRLVITPESIDMTPIPVLGYSSTVPETRSVSEFKSVDYVKSSNGGRNGPTYRIFLRSVLDKKDLVVDAPGDTDKHQFAAQLGAALNLQVNDYVRN